MTLAVGSRLGPYEILSSLGAGGMGDGGIWIFDTATGKTSEVVPAVKPLRKLSDFDLAADESFLLLLEDTVESDIWMVSTE